MLHKMIMLSKLAETTTGWLRMLDTTGYNDYLSTIGAAVVLYGSLKGVYFIYNNFRTSIVGRCVRLGVDLKTLGSWAVVTGPTDGIGKQFAKQLAEQGLNIVLVSRSTDKLNKVAAEIESTSGVKTKCITADFTDCSMEFYERIKAELSDLDIAILLNNAGISGMNDDVPDLFLNIPDELSLHCIRVNCCALTMMARIVLPQMLAKNKGAIVNVSSVAASLQVCPTGAVYCATKCYVTSFSRSLQLEYKSSGLIIQTLEPPVVSTKLTHYARIPLFSLDPESYVRSAIRTIGVKAETTGLLGSDLQLLMIYHWPSFIKWRLGRFILWLYTLPRFTTQSSSQA